MPRYTKEREHDDGWSRWVPPVMSGYKMACCDCGLVHETEFQAVRVIRTNEDGMWEYEELDRSEYRVLFRARRNNRSTGQVRRHLPANAEMNHVESAANAVESIARLAHVGQTRRDGMTPYIEHPRAVAEMVKGDKDAESVAWLHDVLEDTKETAETLRFRGVSPRVIEAVEAMTKRKGEPYADYLQRVQSNPLARKVKIADMLANLSDSPTDRQILKYAKGLHFLLATLKPDMERSGIVQR